jgi:uncharacterized protein
MVTSVADCIGTVLFGKTRRAVLALLFNHPDERFHLRQIVRRARAGVGAVQRELRELTAAGILCRTDRGNQSLFQPDPDCPVFAELKSMVAKTIGIGDALRDALESVGKQIRVAFVFGSFGSGQQRQSSDIDLMVIGDVRFSEVVDLLHETQRLLSREINPVVYTPADLRAKLAAKSNFVSNVIAGEKIFLIGDDHELGRMVQERLAQEARPRRAANQPTTGSRRSRPARQRRARTQ